MIAKACVDSVGRDCLQGMGVINDYHCKILLDVTHVLLPQIKLMTMTLASEIKFIIFFLRHK